MMKDLRLSRQLDKLQREEFWDILISESERAYQQERDRIKARSQQRDAVIHAEINKVKQEHEALEEQRQKQAQEMRLQQQAEMKRQEVGDSVSGSDFALLYQSY